MKAGSGRAGSGVAGSERLQKVLSQLGLASRREAEGWIRAGRLSVNGKPAVLGLRVSAQDQLRLDGRLIRQRVAKGAGVVLCHRSPGEPLLPGGSDEQGPGSRGPSLAERLPRRAGLRFISISPMPTMDGGLELLSADGTVAESLQRAVHALEVEFSLRVRGEIIEVQQQSIHQGLLDSGERIVVRALEPTGGEASNRWYRLVALGASGKDIRQLIERQGVTLVRALRTRLGSLVLPRTLARGQWRELEPGELNALLGSPGTVP